MKTSFPSISRTAFLFLATAMLHPAAMVAQNAPAAPSTPEPGSAELLRPNKQPTPQYDPALPNVLIIGDSISIGYTPYVIKQLQGKANVIHAPGNNGASSSLVAGVKGWAAHFPEVKKWDVIHFNAGLHDLKRMKTENGASKPSNDPNDPPNTGLVKYKENMERVVASLKSTGAKLIFATTTPYPAGSKPARVPEDAAKYNEVALQVMKEQGIAIDDLSSAIAPGLAELQLPTNVHFKPAGSEFLATQVTQSILTALGKNTESAPPAKK